MNVKIFRINYKSDFILTLNSDAGWMTPFCIKFWTGAPSQAYFVGWDGETYTHCAYDPTEPTKLLVQFDDHHLPIGDLKFQIAYHFTVADFPDDTEDEVINPASITVEIDGEHYQVMLDFTGETAPEIEFSLPAYANEAQRIANEEARIAAEQQRIANEEARIAAETIRQQNEQQRIDQETARVNEFATLKSQSQAATRDANAAATLANEKAQLAADKAALADDAATLAIQKAQLAADKAALANDAAQLAADKAALAQQKAEYAQQQGGYAKDQGDYAKNQGNYAKEQGEIAQADHERAEADHGIAVDDHTQAGNDHTRAESDHGIAVNDHTQAGNDHTRAESDHGIAVDDHTQAGNDHTRAEADHGIAADDHTQAGNDHTRAESDHTRAESDHAAVEPFVDSLGAFDISAYHATGGVLAKYSDLTEALGTNGANIPDALRKGGMSVKYVDSSDNKYVQYRLMAQNFTTDTIQWQGIDDVPTAGSQNLVKSGGVTEGLANYSSLFIDDVPFACSALKSISGNLKPKYLILTNFVVLTSYIEISVTLTTDKNDTILFSIQSSSQVPSGKAIIRLEDATQDNYILLSVDCNVKPNIKNVSYSIDVTKYTQLLYESVEQLNVELYGGTKLIKIDNFSDKGKFLYNQSTLDSAQYNITDYIDISEASKLVLHNVYASTGSMKSYVFYDTEKIYISSNPAPEVTGANNYEILKSEFPLNAKYIRCTENTSYKADIKVYNITNGLVNNTAGLTSNVSELTNDVANLSIEIIEIDENVSKINIIEKLPKNSITDFTTYSGKHFNSQGNLADSQSFTASAFIEITPGVQYTFSKFDDIYGGYTSAPMAEVCFYKADKSYLPDERLGTTSTFTAPSEAHYLRFAVFSKSYSSNGIDDISQCEIVVGETVVNIFGNDFFENTISKTNLYGKKWMLIGDSNTHHNARANVKYDEFITVDTGIIPQNIAVSGAGFRVYMNTNYVFINILNSFYQDNPNYIPDFITIMGGSNDVVYDTDNLGVYTDTTEATVFGMMYLLIQRIKEIYPNVPFAIITPFPHNYTGDISSKNQYLEPFVDEQIKFCKLRNVPCLDLYHFSGIRPEEPTFNLHYFSSPASPNGDGLHLNYFGQKLIAPRIRKFLLEYFGQ